jgi:hypothetical protein
MGVAGDIDASYLASVKRSHAVLVAFWTTVAVGVAGTGAPMGQGLTNLAFFFGGIYEAVTRVRLFGPEESVGKVIGGFFGSFFVGSFWQLNVMMIMVNMNWIIMCVAGSSAVQPVQLPSYRCIESAPASGSLITG